MFFDDPNTDKRECLTLNPPILMDAEKLVAQEEHFEKCFYSKNHAEWVSPDQHDTIKSRISIYIYVL